MLLKKFVLNFGILVGAHANTNSSSNDTQSTGLSWESCGLDDASLRCTNFTVPLDYTDSASDATIQLQLLKVPAIHTPKKGSILFNFGGPGLEARLTLAGLSKRLLALTGGEYDLIAHDPRGTAQTHTASCFKTTEERNAALSGIENIADPEDRLTLGNLWGTSQVVANSCFEYPEFREKGSTMGTAFTARDLMQIVDAVEEDGLLRYWGLSYGSPLGATVAAMFPDRIDRIIIDAVMNPHQLFNYYDTEVWADADMVFSSFIKECLKAPDQCGFTHLNMTASDIEEAVYSKIEDFKTAAVAVGTQVINSANVRTFIRFSLYSPGNYPDLSKALGHLLSDNLPEFLKIYNDHMETGLAGSLGGDEAGLAIPCSDKVAPQQTFEEITEIVKELYQTSRLIGSSGNGLAMICANWKFQAKERYEGNFDVKTKYPMLVIGNKYDSATPLRSAQNITASFEGSVLLEHGGFGHGSWSHGSACTSRAIRSYFMEGTLPEHGKFCETDYGPFENKTVDDVLKDIGFMDAE